MRFYHRLLDGFNFLAALTIVAIMMLMIADITLRAMFRYPLHGVPEIIKMSVIAIAWWQIPYALKNRLHLRSTLLLDRFPPLGRNLINTANSLAGFVLMGLIAWFAYPELTRSWATGAFEGEHPFRIAVWPIWTVIVVGAGLTAVEYLIQTFQSMAGRYADQAGHTE